MSDQTSSSEGAKNGFRSFLLIVLGLVIFGAITAWVLCSYRMNNKTYDQTRAEERTKKLVELQQKEGAILDQYAVVDEAKGIYRVPISKGMELTVEELKNKPLRAAGAIPAK